MSSLLRSTKFVRYFSGAARTLILNSAKTAEATTFNQKSLCAINNVLMREYATSKKTENLEPLLQRLDSEVKRYGRISKKDIDEVLDEIKVKNDITSSQSLLVIRCCGELVPEELPEQRTLLVQKIWSVLTERGIPMDISHYNALLRVYIENEHPFSPAQFLEELENKGLQPNRVTYQRLMWRYCQDGDVDGATKVLEKMRELSMPVSEPVLNALVMGHAFHGDTDGAKAVLETMAGAGLQPTNHTYKLLACGFAKKGDIEGVESIIKTSSEKDAYLTDRDILEIMEHLIVGGHSDKMDSLLPHLQKGFGYNQDVMNLILRLLNKGHEEPAKKVMKTMPKSPNSDDTIFKGAFFVKQLLRLNRPAESVIKLCKELKQENLVPNAFFIATECALQHGHAELAQKLFKELQQDGTEIRQHYYWPLLVLKSKERDEEGLLQLLRDMAKEGLAPTGEALRDYVIPFLLKNDKPQNVIVKLQVANVPAIVSARNVMIEVLEKGNMKEATEIATQFFIRGQFSLLARPLLNAFAKTKDINSLVTILHVASSRLPSQGDIDSSHDDVNEDNNVANEVGRIVKTAVKLLNSPVSCELLLNALYEKGMSISTDYAQQIEQYLDKNLTTEISELLAKLTSSDLEMVPVEPNKKRGQSQQRNSTQLELLIEQIKSREGSSNINRLQKQLLELYVKENNVEKLNSYLDELKSTDFELSAATLAHLFEFYCSNDDIEKAKDCYNQIRLKYPDFTLSVYKSVCMAHALVKVEKFDEAINYLKDNKPTSAMVNDSFLHNSKCWQILNYLAETKDDKKVAEMTEVLLSNKYIEPSNVILGPSIKVHILKEDLEGALKEFENACKKYRSTPWKGELMKTLIMKEDATKLQWVADLSTQIHGEVNILHDLVLAFVECGRLRQARRILETPGMHTRQRRLDDACQRYVNEGQSEHLEGLLEATRELSHIDRSNIFYHLLVTYCNTDDTDKALGLWTVLQEQGEVPSDQFLATLGKHLKSKNIQVPFIIPEAQKTEIKEQQKSTRQSSTANEQLPTSSISANVEKLVQDGKPSQAMDLALKYIQEGKMPRANVMKYTLKNLALEGNVEKIQAFGKYIDENTKRQVTYDDKLTMAIFKRGTGPQHIDNLYEAVKSASNDQELEMALKKFPRSNALASVMDEPELLEKCQQVAELAASRGQTNPANLLWMEFTLIGKEKEANELWDKTLKDSSGIIFRRLLQESFVRKSPEMIHKLIDLLKTNKNTTQGCLGNVYGRLISYYMTVENDTKKAIAVFKDAKASGLSREHLNSKILDKFSASVQESGLKVDV